MDSMAFHLVMMMLFFVNCCY